MAGEGGEKSEHRRSLNSEHRDGRPSQTQSALDPESERDGPDAISPLILGKSKEVDDLALDSASRASTTANASKHLLGGSRYQHLVQSPKASPTLISSPSYSHSSAQPSTPADDGHAARAIVAQAWEWLRMEQQKRKLKRHKPKRSRESLGVINEDVRNTNKGVDGGRRGSSGSDTSTALDQLEEILKKDISISGPHRRSSTRKKSHILRRSASSLRPRRPSITGGSSDTDIIEKDISVPTCEAWLDNSRTLSRITGISSIDEAGDPGSASMSQREQEAWAAFQYEILRIAHTLQLKRWRRIPLERSDQIVVERLSGALTNAVYTVSPPKDLGPVNGERTGREKEEALKSSGKALPGKLLLRIYGPQVEHLIDRDAELQILKRLGRQNIGPRLLGTFNNGRFEEYLHAKPLKPADLRQPDTSRQIAKRMRELHDGIDLTKTERQNGPFVWRNWDKWLVRCTRIVSYIDDQVSTNSYATPAISRLRKRGFVCGTSWDFFKKTVDRVRKELIRVHGGVEQLKQELVFAHNDTQYGNILRQEPPGESPLLLPANVHKQLVVIDFEYANANTRGLEFANHFTEWCYNYHDPENSFECQASYYPTSEEQRHFLRAYLKHQPQFAPAAMTPRLRPARRSTSSLASFSTSTRTCSFPQLEQQQSNSSASSVSLGEPALPAKNGSVSVPVTEHIDKPQDNVEPQINELMHETRLWRIANSAQWIAWGIVQARVPGLPNEPHAEIAKDTATDWSVHTPSTEDTVPLKEASYEEEDVEFDYLSYARSRAMFFWGDCVQYGLVKEQDLPDDARRNLKIVSY